ncbi:hypothetical protein [Lysobacter gummosus]|uniref:hypothetical protein n=1 Tax=Lysobacter gummosus TaxID=262324 RepID=UPI00362A6AEA
MHAFRQRRSATLAGPIPDPKEHPHVPSCRQTYSHHRRHQWHRPGNRQAILGRRRTRHRHRSESGLHHPG